MNDRQLDRAIQNLLQELIRRTSGTTRVVVVALLVAALVGFAYFAGGRPAVESTLPRESPSSREPRSATTRPPTKSQTSESRPRATPGPSANNGVIEKAFRQRRSNLIVEGTGVVKKVLPDDEVGDRHQKLILRLASGQSLLLAHNIDLADRVPARVGDLLSFRGEYEFSEEGGVIHWTHHDPGGRHEDGWIQLGERKYE